VRRGGHLAMAEFGEGGSCAEFSRYFRLRQITGGL